VKIPKTIHQVWIGPKAMPDEFKRYSQQWIKHHPGWEWKLWSSENLPPLINQASFNESPSWAGKCDIARLEIVYQFGGMYVDTDFECYKNVEPLIEDHELFAGLEPQKDGSTKVNNSLFGSIPKHPSLKRIIDLIPDRVEDLAACGPTWQSGPDFLTNVIKADKAWYLIPSRYLHPYGHFERKTRAKEAFPEAYAVHRWASTWIDQGKAVAFIVPVHNQLAAVQKTIESALVQPDSEYVLVDWGSTDGTEEWVKKAVPQARYLNVKTERPFNLAYACNIGSGMNGGMWQCFMDPGVRLSRDFVSTMMTMGNGDRFYVNKNGEPTWITVVNKGRLYNLGGYDAIPYGVGFGSEELFTRLRLTGARETALPDKLAQHLNVADVQTEDPSLTMANSTYAAVKCDLITLNIMPMLEMSFRRQMYRMIFQAYEESRKKNREQRFEIEIKPLSVRKGTYKERGTVRRTLQYTVMHG
jgi:mannosyltransferase OCH1-like enzyme